MQLADIFTKALDANQFEVLRGKLGLCIYEDLQQLIWSGKSKQISVYVAKIKCPHYAKSSPSFGNTIYYVFTRYPHNFTTYSIFLLLPHTPLLGKLHFFHKNSKMSQHQNTSTSKTTKSIQKVSAPSMDIFDDEILDVVPLSVILCEVLNLNHPMDASASACPNQGNISSIPSGSIPATNSKEDIHHTDRVIRNLVIRILNERHSLKGVSTPLSKMYPSPKVEQHSEKDDDFSSSEKDMAAEGLCSLGQTVSDKGKYVASKIVDASHSKKHDNANDVNDLEDDRSDDQEDNLLHHLKPSVAKCTKTRKGRSVAELMSARKAKKTVGIGPSKSWSKVEVKKRKVREDSESEEDVEEDIPVISPVKKIIVRKSHVKVAAVHLDNMSFHLEDGAAKWKFVIQRRVVVERELGKDIDEVKEVMDLIKAVGLLKTVAGFSQCYKGELEATDNEVCRQITTRQVKCWPIKKHLPAGKLTVKYAILHKIRAANLVHTNHISTIANTLGRFIFVVGTKVNFDYGRFIFEQIIKHASTNAVKLPIALPSMI
ncbi:uncharacterized protein LOC127137213 [Lathyrus oleraceus]|uniref:uncharacterized protein LOC127137213 n=1 Tax=Pisum sativum TaxID=3888 RepID=UPI0021D1C465|nr:uncharacterized protein LOC127137213 [Pisum sativum]